MFGIIAYLMSKIKYRLKINIPNFVKMFEAQLNSIRCVSIIKNNWYAHTDKKIRFFSLTHNLKY